MSYGGAIQRVGWHERLHARQMGKLRVRLGQVMDDPMAQSLAEAVSSVAIQIDDAQAFRERAAAVAQRLGPSAIAELEARLHSPPYPEPPGFAPRERGYGGWLSAWQFAIFEIFLEFGAAALPLLRQSAFGEYDWTQGNAIEVLVRLAARGIEREEITAELRREFPGLRFEAQLYAVGPLLEHAARDPAVAAVVRELEDIPGWREAVVELQGGSSAQPQ